MIWADREGNIGWQTVGIAPLRVKSSGMVPVTGEAKIGMVSFPYQNVLPA